MLTLNGHNSHETRRIKRAAFDHNVIIIVLPLKMTHKLQPLDIGVFSSVQCKWSRHCDKCLAEGVCINRFNFIPEYLAIYHTIDPLLVQKAFAKCGIYSLNLAVFNKHDFAPSQASSSIPTFPPSYPHKLRVPSSAPSDPNEILGSSGDQDTPGSSDNSCSSPDSPAPSLSTDCISHPVSITPHQPTLPQLPPYDYVISCMPKEMWDFMRLHQVQCELVLKEAIA